jgi:ABC-type bacteriocin/lantibiotic exporter with double-glycine peptidase domain
VASPIQYAPNWTNMNKYAQNKPTECWYVAYRMMYSYKGWDEGTILDKLRTAGVNADSALKTGLITNTFMKAAKAVGLRAMGFGQSLSAYDFKTMLTMGPVWTAGKWNADTSHVVVVVGASDTQIVFIDPWNDTVREAEQRTWFVDDFVHGLAPIRNAAPGTDFFLGDKGGWIGQCQCF